MKEQITNTRYKCDICGSIQNEAKRNKYWYRAVIFHGEDIDEDSKMYRAKYSIDICNGCITKILKENS